MLLLLRMTRPRSRARNSLSYFAWLIPQNAAIYPGKTSSFSKLASSAPMPIIGWPSSTLTCLFPFARTSQLPLTLHIEITQASSPMTNSSPSSAPTSVQMPYLLTSTGALCIKTFRNTFFIQCSDWVKLYLGKKNGAHVLGCLSRSSGPLR